ncbi:MAG: hypothetical protein JOZ65_19465 [Chloroflexi bacterium]|nr:hypothetical protein [Chloroflexota bacterium]
MSVTISLTLDDDLVSAITAAFDGDPAVTCTRFTQIAVEELAAWLSNRSRYRSLTDLYSIWVERLSENLLPDQVPDVDLLYGAFNLPYGQAQYIARLIANKSQTVWRAQALERLKRDLATPCEQSLEAVRKGKTEATRAIGFRTTRLAALELQRICNTLWRTDSDFQFPSAKGAMGDQRSFEMPAASLSKVCNALGAKA